MQNLPCILPSSTVTVPTARPTTIPAESVLRSLGEDMFKNKQGNPSSNYGTVM